MSSGRSAHTATLLPNGKVLVAGGMATLETNHSSAEVFDPQAELWLTVSPMHSPRSGHSATLLADGTLLIVGGWYQGETMSTAEAYDPATDTWSPVASMFTPRAHHTATLLHDGRVLVTGGWSAGSPVASAEIYDPLADTWTASRMLAARGAHTATLLPDGRVIIIGGDGGGSLNYLNTVESYDPASDTWSAIASMVRERRSHSAALLPDGRMLVTGGETTYGDPIGGGYTTTPSGEVYDPRNDVWSDTAPMSVGRSNHTATTLRTGKVLVIGADMTPELYDPVTDTWSFASTMAVARGGHSTTLLPDGRVLVAGAWNNASPLGLTEVYGSQSSPAATEREEGNLVTNASFEKVDAASPDQPAGWDVPPDGTYSRADGHASASHVKSPLVAGTPFGTCSIDAARWSSQKKIAVEPGIAYVLEYWVKTSNRSPDIHALVVATVDFYDTRGRFLSGAAVEREAPLSDGWEQVGFTFGAAGIPWPAETSSVVVGFGGGGWTESCEIGRVYGEQAFDDVSFRPTAISLPLTGTGARDSTIDARILVSITMLGAALFFGIVVMTRNFKRRLESRASRLLLHKGAVMSVEYGASPSIGASNWRCTITIGDVLSNYALGARVLRPTERPSCQLAGPSSSGTSTAAGPRSARL